MQVDWFIVAISQLTAATVASVAGAVYLWGKHLQRSFIVKNGNVIGEYIEYYCTRNKYDIDQVVLVANEMDEDVTVYQVQHIDFYPELWGEEHE